MKNRVIVRFILFYFLSYVIFAFASTKFTPFLSSLGYSAFERGIILSSYAITNIIFQLLFGLLSDKYQTMKKIVLVSVVVFGLSTAILFALPTAAFTIYLLLVALSGGLLNTCCGLYDTWMMGCEDKVREKMSFVKTFGSIGWAIGSLIASYIILKFSYLGLSASIVIIILLLIINLMMLPDIEKVESGPKFKITEVLELFKNKDYVIIVLVYCLLYSMIVANNCTVIDKMIYLNASDTQISLKWSLQSFLEMPTYLAGSYLLFKFKGTSLAKLSALMMVLQFILFALANTPQQIVMCCVFQVFSTPLVLITSKVLIQEIAPERLRNSSQLVALSIFMGGSSLLIPSLMGYLSESLGYNITIGIIATFGVIAYFLISKIKSI